MMSDDDQKRNQKIFYVEGRRKILQYKREKMTRNRENANSRKWKKVAEKMPGTIAKPRPAYRSLLRGQRHFDDNIHINVFCTVRRTPLHSTPKITTKLKNS